MWIRCKCNYKIHDSSDFLFYKGYIVSDQDWFDFLDLVSEAIKSEEKDREKLVSEIYSASSIEKLIYQCPKCGQLYIEDGQSGELCSFYPDSKVNKRLLESAYGSEWKGYLSAYWDDEIKEWSKHKGVIFPDVNINLENEELYWDDRGEEFEKAYFWDDRVKFEKAYYSLFEYLKGRNILRWASLKVNDKRVHEWSNEDKYL